MQKTDLNFAHGKTRNLVVVLPCVKCKLPTKHQVMASFDEEGCVYDKSEGWSADWKNNYQVVKCKGCDSASFRHLHWDSESENRAFGENGETERLFPKRSANSIDAKPLINAPKNVRRIYKEAVECFNNDCFTLCAAGLRAIVESICIDKNIVDGPISEQKKGGETKIVRRTNLQGKIAGLSEKKLLAPDHADILHKFRHMGNDAVHEFDQPSAADLRSAINIIEHTVENLYDLPINAASIKHSAKSRRK
jgi:hypothetical protein